MSKPKPILFDSHMHTPLCKHAKGHPREYVEFGANENLAGVIFTCHSPMPNRFSDRIRMRAEQLEEYRRIVSEGEDVAPKGFSVLIGLESDYFPGMEGWLEDLHQRLDFHYILGSVHWHLSEYIDAFWKGDVLAFRNQYFEHLAISAETGLFDCLSHPDLVKNMEPMDWEFEVCQPSIEKTLDRIAATGVAMEINTSGLNKNYPEMNPGNEMLALMAQRKIPIVLGSDSHIPERVGENFNEALKSLVKAGYDQVSHFRERQRIDLPIDEAIASLR